MLNASLHYITITLYHYDITSLLHQNSVDILVHEGCMTTVPLLLILVKEGLLSLRLSYIWLQERYKEIARRVNFGECIVHEERLCPPNLLPEGEGRGVHDFSS